MRHRVLPFGVTYLLVLSLLLGGCGPSQEDVATQVAVAAAATVAAASTATPYPTYTPAPTSSNTPSPPPASTSTPTSTPTCSPTATPTLTPTSTPTPDPSAGRVIGSIKNAAHTALALFRAGADGSFTIKVNDDTPQTATDASGRFEFSSVPPGVYMLFTPFGDGSFQMYDPPLDSDLIEDILVMDMWTFRVDTQFTIDLGVLSRRQ